MAEAKDGSSVDTKRVAKDGAVYRAVGNDEGTTENLVAEENAKMNVVINGTTFELELDHGAAAQEFKEMCLLRKRSPLTPCITFSRLKQQVLEAAVNSNERFQNKSRKMKIALKK